MSPARAQKTNARTLFRSSRGPCRKFFHSSSPPPPPPPVGRRSTGGLPPMPGDLRSISVGVGVKMEGMTGPSLVEVTLTLTWTHEETEEWAAKKSTEFQWRNLSLKQEPSPLRTGFSRLW